MILETVGVGQVEIEVAAQADTTVVVVAAGWGDAVQASKAGLTEVADVFVVNKADRPGAKEAARDLGRMLDMSAEGSAGDAWRPPVLCTTATTGEGVEEVWRAVLDHRESMVATGGLEERRRRRAAEEIRRLVAARLLARAEGLTAGPRAGELADAVARGDVDPWTAADELLA